MSIKAVLEKVRKGETLDDEEKQILADYDPDKSAAAARKGEAAKVKELEAKLAELTEKLDEAGNAGKSEAEKLKIENDKTAKKLAEYKSQVEALTKEKGEIVRGYKLAKIAGGLKLVAGVDPELVSSALKSKLGTLKDEELDDEKAVLPILKAFRESNKALLLDESGHGAGLKNDGSNRAAGSGAKEITRAEFDSLPIGQRQTFKGTVKD